MAVDPTATPDANSSSPDMNASNIDLTRMIAKHMLESRAKVDNTQPNAWINRAGTDLGNTIGGGMLYKYANDMQNQLKNKLNPSADGGWSSGTSVSGPGFFDSLSNMFSGWGS